jgi:hypothetical protein
MSGAWTHRSATGRSRLRNQEPARIRAGTKRSRQRFNLEPGSKPMTIIGPRIVILALFAVILPIEFALAQGGAAAQNGSAGVGAPTSTAAGTAPSPPITGQSAPPAPAAVQGIAEQAPDSTTGLSRPAADGSTRTVPSRPCSAAAHETDGTSTCVGIPR